MTAPKIITVIAKATIPLGPPKAPDRIRLWAPGPIVGDFGRNVWDETAARDVMAAYAERGNVIPIDIEHASNPKSAAYNPAAEGGGYAELKLQADGSLWLDPIAWSDRARREIESGSRRAVSPDWSYDRETGRPVRINAVSLVQNPGTYEIGLMASASNGAKKTMIDPIVMAALKAALTAEDPKAAIEALIAQLESADAGGGPASTEMGGGTDPQDPKLLAAMTDEQKAMCRAQASAFLAQLGGKAKPAQAQALASSQAPSLEQVRAEARAAGVQAYREESAKDSLIASASGSPGMTAALASQLRRLPLATVKELVGSLPPAPAKTETTATAGATTDHGGVKVGALAGAAAETTTTAAKPTATEQVTIDRINEAAKSGSQRIAEARAAAENTKIDPSAPVAEFSAFSQMGRTRPAPTKASN